MSDLTDLTTVAGEALTDAQVHGILAQIDLDIMNCVRDGKLAALRYGIGGAAGQQSDRAGNLRALLEARQHYEELLRARPAWETSTAACVLG